MLNSYAPLEIVSCAVGDKHNRYSGAENNDESAKVIDENYLAHPMYPQLHLNARCSRHCLVLRSSQSIAQASANASEASASWLVHAPPPTSRLIILTILLQTDMCSGLRRDGILQTERRSSQPTPGEKTACWTRPNFRQL